MTFQEATEAYETIESAGKQHADFPELRHAFYQAAVRYAHIRAEWVFLSIADRAAQDPARTMAHDGFISYCDLLGRFMAKEGWGAGWRDRLGNDRQDIGDFACYLHALLGISAR